MTFPKSKQHNSSPPLPLHFQQAFTNLQTHCHVLFTNISNHFNTHLSNFASFSSTSPIFARIPHLNETQIEPIKKGPKSNHSMSNEAIEERLAGVPVYALSNSDEEFVLVKGSRSGKSLGLFCFGKEDAYSLLNEMKLINPSMRRGSSVVTVALNKVFQLKLSGVAFRLIPEASQIKNALTEKEKVGSSDDEILGVPVFQSRSLILRSQNKSFRPVFFRKEDLENSLLRASRQQRKLNPLLRQGDIEVASLEDIIKGMKDDSCAKWDDVVFIPPGFDVSTDSSQLGES